MAGILDKPIWSADGLTLSNVLLPVTNLYATYNVNTEWYDGTLMDDSKLDTDLVYVKFEDKYLLRNMEYGQVLQKDTMLDMRSISTEEILLLRLGVYKHVQLNGYYVKEDTPSPINYILSNTAVADDDGSIIAVGGVKLEHIFTDTIDASYFGFIGDGVTDNTIRFRNMSACAKRSNVDMAFTKRPSQSYFVQNSVDISNSISFNLCKLTTGGDYKSLLRVIANNVSITTHNIVTVLTSGTNSPISIDFRGVNGFYLTYGQIDGGRIRAENADFVNYTNFNISDNIINCDLTGYSSYDIQNDVFTLYNLVDLSFRNNIINAKNVNRVFKVSSFDSTGVINTYNLNFDKNIINSTTLSTKQMFDFYQHSRSVNITNNFIRSYGHNSVIENKTTGFRSTGYATNFKVTGNTFETDGTPLRMFGSYQSNQGNNSGYQDVYFENNTVRSTNLVSSCVNIMAYHFVSIKGNSFESNLLSGLSPIMRIGNIENLFIKDNSINGQVVIVGDNTIDEATYTPKSENISISGNVFKGTLGSSFISALNISNQTYIYSLSILANTFDYNDEDLTGKRPFFIQNTNVQKLISSNNTSTVNVSFSTSGSVISLLRDLGNSWDDSTKPIGYDYYRNISSSLATAPRQGREIIEYTGTSDATITINLNATLRTGDTIVVKNSSNNRVNITAGSGVNIGGNFFISGPGTFIEFMSLSGGTTFRMMKQVTTATTLVKGLVNQAAFVPNDASVGQLIISLKNANLVSNV